MSYKFTDSTILTYNTLVGEEEKFRHFHNLIFSTTVSENWLLAVQGDYGAQKAALSEKFLDWYGVSLMTQWTLSKTISIAGRAEYYQDRDQIIVTTNQADGFETYSVSLGTNVLVNERVTWRSEVRGFWAKSAIFLGASGLEKSNALIVTSLSLTL